MVLSAKINNRSAQNQAVAASASTSSATTSAEALRALRMKLMTVSDG
jgi:hypothetical protein